jgi:hypothetical protein
LIFHQEFTKNRPAAVSKAQIKGGFMISKLIIISLLLTGFQLAYAKCDLPVCNIKDKIAELEKATSNERFRFITDLKTKNRQNDKIDQLENLRAFAKESKALSIRLKDEDWLITESDLLSNQSIIILLKNKRPLEKNYMMTAFKELTTQDSRFDILQYWNKNVETVVSKPELLGLNEFAELAIPYTKQIKDDDWVTTEAIRLMNSSSVQMSILDPYHEGIYKVTITCPTKEANCRQSYPDLSMMTVIESTNRSGYGLIVSFIQPAPLEPAFFFPTSNFTAGKGLIYGFSNFNTPSFPKPAEFSINLNRETGAVSGHILDTRSEGYVLVKGTPIRRVLDLVKSTSKSDINVAPEEVVGVYNATFAGRVGRFIIKETSEANLIASFLSTKDNYSLDFKIGTFNKAQGLLNLVTFNNDLSFNKLILRFTKTNDKITANGFHIMTADGTSEDWKIEKRGNVVNP